LERFESLISRRLAREPVAYIVGQKEFWSLDFAIGPGVLIPRPDTEILIEELCKTLPDRQAQLSILDLGTGSGCLLIAALGEYPNAHGVGVDASAEALNWAAKNLERHDLEDRASLISPDGSTRLPGLRCSALQSTPLRRLILPVWNLT
jgi:release factor glutamine methyltransferase